MGIEVRRIGPDDWQLWARLRLRSLEDSPDAYASTLVREQAFEEADWRERLDGPAVVAFVDGEPAAIGAAFPVRDGWMQIVAMWTVPVMRGRGLAALVLDELVALARSSGRRVVLDVTRGNAAARSAYERYGFVPTGECRSLREGSSVICEELVLPG